MTPVATPVDRLEGKMGWLEDDARDIQAELQHLRSLGIDPPSIHSAAQRAHIEIERLNARVSELTQAMDGSYARGYRDHALENAKRRQ